MAKGTFQISAVWAVLFKRAGLFASPREQISSTLALLVWHVLARVKPECYRVVLIFQPLCIVQILATSWFMVSTFPWFGSGRSLCVYIQGVPWFGELTKNCRASVFQKRCYLHGRCYICDLWWADALLCLLWSIGRKHQTCPGWRYQTMDATRCCNRESV